MDTAAHHHCLLPITPYHSPPSSNHVRAHTMRGPLSLPLLPLSILTTRINRTLYSMADRAGATTTATIKTAEKKEETEKSAKEIPPPPPEKPEPGDCCGSGCVRCVWDVYYDELEEYNKLYKRSDSNSNS